MNATMSLIWASIEAPGREMVEWETDYWYFAFLDWTK